MPRFTGTYQGQHTTTASIDTVREALSSPEVSAACRTDLDRWEERGDKVAEFFLTPQSYGITTYEGRYTCVYVTDDGSVRWDTDESKPHNLIATGRIRLSALPSGGTRVDADTSIGVELDVGRLIARTIRPIVEAAVRREMKLFLEKVLTYAETRM